MATDIREALLALNVAPLVPKYIDPELVELQRRLAPLLQAIPSRNVKNTTYNFNTRSQRPGAGAVSDGGTRPQTQSSYQQNAFEMCHYMADGGVTGFATEVTQDLIGNLVMEEMDGAMTSLFWTLEAAILHGNHAATKNGMYPQLDGLDTQVSQFNSGAATPVNAIDMAGAALTLSFLNQLIDLAQRNAAMPVLNTNWMVVGSTTAVSKVGEIITQTQQRVNNTVTLPDSGLNVEGYRGLPLLSSSFVSSAGLSMSAITVTGATTGGTIPAGTSYYQVGTVIDRVGETVASAAVAVTNSGSTSANTIAFPTPPTFEGAGATLFAVYKGASSGTCTLLGFVDATVGVAADQVTPVPTTSIIDTGTALVPQNGSTVPSILPTTYFGTNTGYLPRGTGLEDIWLVARTPDILLRPWVRDCEVLKVAPTLLSPDTLPWAVISDTCLATKAPKYLARLRNVDVSL